ncbi:MULTISPECIES: FtsH protease activity modulator HflK [Thalassospira]|jgi:membrane protease subunit HflK|uniref:Protein HflK n=1 Tax=Thalassospira profundimaris TaxID=502049 RepID=A0A367V3V8_9PROT|nr:MULTISPECIES: FtsH protease activity modulator HflK [Thalassospira]MBR9899729.1 FtsH protease activity modulator HflK [Rhodospirillales bacterium]KZB70594.1 HflK protein [Thalassospira sp. MCCC 1A01148]MBO6805510.1 FtsH protease activity modulator HflK [Thalassospira sp.]MBS8273805.1 FtsH protease activity modulator HflK [Thalassospira tepidiphila]RCK19857.1 membrane protein [Thalassospira profundimaris]|tara:strand:+ start:11451 stop:12578 length:1128 start_codon:yes stop_codon:yes gene_type:complete
MPWNNQGGGGPWGGGGNNGGGQNPWGQRPSGGGGGGSTPPDFDEMIRKGQERLKRLFPGGGGYKGFVLIGIAVIGLWLLTGFYRVQPGEQGVTLLFGKWVGTTGPGLNYFLPAPIGEVIKPNVERTNQIEVGYRGAGTVTSNGSRDVPEESLMLTGDQNIIDIDFVVQWRISDAGSYLFNVRDPENTIKLASESAIREVIGKTDLEEALTVGRVRVEEQTRTLLQEIMDGYESGIFIAEVKMQKVDPPRDVIDAFNDVQRARQDRDRSQNEALAYRNDIIPRAKGEAERQVLQARAYKDRVTKEAEGEAERFNSIYNSFLTAQDVTTRRLYLETMQEILSKSDKIIMEQNGEGNGVVPYLPLPEVQKRANAGGNN